MTTLVELRCVCGHRWIEHTGDTGTDACTIEACACPRYRPPAPPAR